jgi:hypothetical protein
MGRLNFTSGFISDYKRIVAPLVSLMGSKAGGLLAVRAYQSTKLTRAIGMVAVKTRACGSK